jgi:hypothetical protein
MFYLHKYIVSHFNIHLMVLDVPPFNPVWSPEQQEEWRRAKKEARKRGKANRENGLRHKGTKITEGHANYVLMYDMLTGIRHAVSGCVAKPYRDLEAADFREKNKLVFDIMGNELTSSSKYEFKFKDYAPWVFRHIRELFRVEAAEYLVSQLYFTTIHSYKIKFCYVLIVTNLFCLGIVDR